MTPISGMWTPAVRNKEKKLSTLSFIVCLDGGEHGTWRTRHVDVMCRCVEDRNTWFSLEKSQRTTITKKIMTGTRIPLKYNKVTEHIILIYTQRSGFRVTL